MADLARIRKLLKPPRPLANSTSASNPRYEQTAENAEEASESKVSNEGDVPKGASILEEVPDPCVPVEDFVLAQDDLQRQSNAPRQDAAPPPTNRPAQWSEFDTRKRDGETKSSGNGAPDNPHEGPPITLTPEDATKILDAIEILQSREAWLDVQLTKIWDLALQQDGQYQWLVGQLRDQERSSDSSSAARRQAEHEAEKKKVQEEAQANQEAATARIRALESKLRRMMEEKKQFALEMEKNQLIHADAEQRTQLAQRRSRLEQQTRELDVRLWREWGEENERKLQAWKDKSRIKNARVLNRVIEGVKLFQALKAHADVQRQRIRELGEQLQQYMDGSITLLPDIDFDTGKLVEIVNNAEKVMTTFLEPLPSPEFSLELSNLDINDDNPVAHCGSLLANLHILDDSASVRNPTSLSSPSKIVSQKSIFKVESGTWPSSPTSSSSNTPMSSNLSHQTRPGPKMASSVPSPTMQQFCSSPLVGFEQYTKTGIPYQGTSQMEMDMISAWARAHGKRDLIKEAKEKAEAQELEEKNQARLRHERILCAERKRFEAEKFAEAQQRWKEEIEQDEAWERKRKRKVEAASFEELRTRTKRAKRTDEEVHALISRLPGGFPEEKHRPRLPWQQGPQTPRTPPVKRSRKPLREPRRTLSPAHRAICDRVARCRALRRERRGISQSRRTLRRLRRALEKQAQEQAQGQAQGQALDHPHPATPKPQPQTPKRKVRFLVDSSPPSGRPVRRSRNHSANSPANSPANHPDAVNRSRLSRLIKFLRDRPFAVVCTVMATAGAVKLWQLWRYEQEYLNANDVPQRIQDMLRADSQTWEWWRILEYELLKGEDRTRLG